MSTIIGSDKNTINMVSTIIGSENNTINMVVHVKLNMFEKVFH